MWRSTLSKGNLLLLDTILELFQGTIKTRLDARHVDIHLAFLRILSLGGILTYIR